MTKITCPGLYADITPIEYFAEPCPAPALTNTTIKVLLDETPADAHYQHTGLNPDAELIKANAAMITGDVVHQIALGKGRGFRIGDFERWDRRNKDVDKFLIECERDGVTAVKQKEFAPLAAMGQIVKDRIEQTLEHVAKKRGQATPSGYQTEVVFAWLEETRFGPVWCRGMADIWCEELAFIGDPKITAALTNSRIVGHTQKQGWPRQAAWYVRGFGAIIPEFAGRLTFANILVKPKPPHTVRCTAPMESWRTAAERECEAALNMFAHCLHNKRWPGYPEGIEMLEPPTWALRDLTEDDDDD
jgi:PDDEXK-like domain of unknown function (DUF3799)